ncbi:uncharacterized protein [Pseudorca crassidens]|uniref:uncharacterized protein isoform X3 n=1 Tax=Pseudorca crassidens TaxID=82174 RepID=UPI00352E3565
MLSHLPRVSREGNYFAHVLNCTEGVLSPAPGAQNFSSSRLQQCAERAVDNSFRQHLLSRSFGVAPQMKTLRKRKVKNLPMICSASTQITLPNSKIRRILVPGPHNRELGVPMANPAERKGETQMREKIKGTLGAIWCCCRPKSSVWNEQTQGHSLLQPPTTLQPFFLSQPLESATQLSSASRTGQHRFLSLVPYH